MAAHQLYLLNLGEMEFANPAKGAPSRVPITSYLIRSDKGRNYLIDTGAPSALVGAETSVPWLPEVKVFIREEDDILVQLSKLGLRPKDIDLLISSHFHFDHCGRHDAFAEANVPSVVQSAHLEYAMAHPDWYDPKLFNFDGWNFELVDGDTEIERGLVLVESSGHSIGHQSVYVDTANGAVLLAIDAIKWPSLAQTRELPAWWDDVEQGNKSIDKLMQFALNYRTYMIFGHDPSQWDTLPHAPRVFSR